MKQTRFDSKNNLSVLAETWVSKANCKQRRGRAGRVRAGICYHLVSRERYRQLDEFEVPEIHRSSLDAVALQIRRLDLGRIDEFLGRALDPPSDQAIQNSVNTLFALRAIESQASQQLTPLGRLTR
jgi:HrpA-like RNA helicase